MTQDEAKKCAREAWIACARNAKSRRGADGEGVSEEAEGVFFDRWWKTNKHTLPGFRR